VTVLQNVSLLKLYKSLFVPSVIRHIMVGIIGELMVASVDFSDSHLIFSAVQHAIAERAPR
jgi:hypothetical protein